MGLDYSTINIAYIEELIELFGKETTLEEVLKDLKSR